MSEPDGVGERMDRDSDLSMFRRDTSTLQTWDPEATGFNKFREVRRDIDMAYNDMNWEETEKYHLKYQARTKAQVELRSLPQCFSKCTTQLNVEDNDLGDSANCIRECYFKRINARNDLNFLYQQKHMMGLPEVMTKDMI